MSISKLKIALAGSVFAAAMASTGAQAATDTGTATAEILQPLVVANTSALDFGTIVTDATGGNVVVSTAGALTCGGALICSGTATAAGFDITGSANKVVTVGVDANVTLTGGSGADMVVSLNSSGSPITLSGTGTGNFTVGGTLPVAANQGDGVYSGTFTATVNYQ